MPFAVRAVDDGPLVAHLGDQSHSPHYPAVYSGVTYQGRGVIVLRFDDGTSGDYSTIYPLVRDRYLHAGFALISSHLDQAGKLTTAQALEMQGRGMELLCHSATHGSNPTSWADFVAETTAAQAALRAKSYFCESFVQPGTWTGDYHFDTAAKWDTRAGRHLRANFAAAESYVTDGVIGSLSPLPSRVRYGVSHTTGDTWTLANLQGLVDYAIRFGGRQEVLFHSANIGQPGNISLADFTTFLTYVQTKRAAGLIDVLTPTASVYAQPASQRVNLLYDGGFEQQATGTFVGWVGYNGAVVSASGRTGNALETTAAGAGAYQDVLAGNLRALRIEFWAKPKTGTSARFTVTFTAVDGTPTTYYSYANAQNLTSSSWTKFGINVGCHPSATYVRVAVAAAASSAADVLYDDVVLTKV